LPHSRSFGSYSNKRETYRSQHRVLACPFASDGTIVPPPPRSNRLPAFDTQPRSGIDGNGPGGELFCLKKCPCSTS
jgi:hypothetical protein